MPDLPEGVLGEGRIRVQTEKIEPGIHNVFL